MKSETKENPHFVPKYWPESVEQILARVRLGDPVRLTWIDASESSGVRAEEFIPNHNIESVIQSYGLFCGLKKGTSYADLHVLIEKDRMDGRRIKLQSVPLVLVKAIEILRGKTPLIRIGSRKTIVRFADGSVKKIGGS